MISRRLPGQHLEHRRVVVKVGTNLLTGGGEQLEAHVLAALTEQIADARELGGQVVLVSSGAIAAGRHRLGDGEPGRRDLPTRQVLAAVGQSRLMSLWDELFELRGVVVAQALLTRRDLADRLGYLNARTTLLGLLERGVVPIVNENDVVSIEEIRDTVIGDNDSLSAEVANLVDADLLLLLTDIAGLYTADPRHHADAQLISRVERIDAAIEAAAAGQPGARGTGGMATKVAAARAAAAAGAHVVIADGRSAGVVLRAASGEAVGTHFLPTGDRVDARRRYLLSNLQARGRLVVDDGAARALEFDGKSLLPAGVLAVDGEFQRGDVVRIVTSAGHELAAGSVNYAAVDIARIRGLHSERIAEALGYEYGEEIVHRNQLVLL
ncbi:MAG: glutamate 5-kinase [Chloroflexi bacterium]|nr:glutamate 5-kinase [Chloroflexota bacterium]